MGTSRGAALRVFDAHCHLQDPRILPALPHLLRSSLAAGVRLFAVNGTSQKDWHIVKQLADDHPSIVPCFGLHPWFVDERSPDWFSVMKELLHVTPSAAIGEAGLDKGSHGKQIDFQSQVHVFRLQLELANELKKPISLHCVRAYGDLLEILQSMGPFPAGVILHSFLGSAEMVPPLAKLGAYFSFSGFLLSMKPAKAKKMLKSIPTERILLETDAPDALPPAPLDSLKWVPGDKAILKELNLQEENMEPGVSLRADRDSHNLLDTSTLPKATLNHPANIHVVLKYVASLLEISGEELAEVSYQNATRLFSYQGSKITAEDRRQSSCSKGFYIRYYIKLIQ